MVLCHRPGLEFLAVLCGCLLAGAVAIPASPRNRRALGAAAGAAFSVEAEGEGRLVIVHEVDHRATDDLAEVARAIRQAVLRDHAVPVHAVVLLRHGGLPPDHQRQGAAAAVPRAVSRGGAHLVAQRWRALDHA